MGGLTYDGEDERVGEVSVEGQLHGVPPQLQSLDGLCQADKYVHGGQGEHSDDIRTHCGCIPDVTCRPARSGSYMLYYTVSPLSDCIYSTA